MIPIIKQITRENIDFRIECTDYTLHIQIDQQDFENALLNLLINARDAIDESSNDKSIISITIQRVDRQTESYLSLAISDTGCGIPEAAQSKIFEPFYTTKLKGTGLGLSMVQSVVERAHGSISISSAPTGSTITILFPLAEASNPSEDTSLALVSSSSSEPSYTLLIVDDEPLVRQMLAEYLSRHQFATYMAENVEAAKELLQTTAIDLILSDVNMPGSSGITLHKHCKIHYPDTHCILMTGFTNETIDESIIVLSKPMRMPVLLDQIQQILHASTVAS